jgi:hypothetical protein
MKTKKPKLCAAQRGFFFVKHPPEDHATKEHNPFKYLAAGILAFLYFQKSDERNYADAL